MAVSAARERNRTLYNPDERDRNECTMKARAPSAIDVPVVEQLPDLASRPLAIASIAALTFLSGTVVAFMMREAHAGRSG